MYHIFMPSPTGHTPSCGCHWPIKPKMEISSWGLCVLVPPTGFLKKEVELNLITPIYKIHTKEIDNLMPNKRT